MIPSLQKASHSVSLVALAMVSVLPSCKDDDSSVSGGGDCAMCATMSEKCQWPSSSYDYCVSQCTSRISKNKPACDNELKEAFACFNRQESWSCTSSNGLIGCSSEMGSYDACLMMDCTEAKNPVCAVCASKYQECSWQFMDQCSCQSACENYLELTGDCQTPYDALSTCLADPKNWSCDGSVNGCQEKLETLRLCNGGDTSWRCAEAEKTAGTWTTIASLPKYINAFATDPTQASVVYAAAGSPSGSGIGLYKSTDSGLTWVNTSNNLPGEAVVSVAASTDAIWALVGMDIYKSTDQGGSWAKRTTQMIMGFAPTLAAHPAAVESLFLFSDNVMRSDDQAATWQEKISGLPVDISGTHVQALVFDPATAGVLYAGTGMHGSYGNGVFKTTTRGETWTASNVGMLDASIRQLATLPGGQVFALSDESVLYTSTDAAGCWTPLTIQHGCVNSPREYRSKPQAMMVVGDQLLVVLGTGHLLRSKDMGLTWELLTVASDALSQGYDLVVGNTKGDTAAVLVGVSDSGVYRFQL